LQGCTFVPGFSGFFLAQVIVAGIFFGIVALLLIELFNLFKKAAERLPLWSPAKGIIGGAALILLTLIFSTQYLGLGLATTQARLQGQQAVWYAFPLKIVFTSIRWALGEVAVSSPPSSLSVPRPVPFSRRYLA
jgi:H+/Cl- antiporter ClcA